MERESLSDALATLCSWFVIPFLVMLLMYLLFYHGSGLLWATLPALVIIFFIKHQAEKNR